MVDYSDGEEILSLFYIYIEKKEILKLETEPKKLYKFKYITFS